MRAFVAACFVAVFIAFGAATDNFEQLLSAAFSDPGMRIS
jgi:hypothetical protein